VGQIWDTSAKSFATYLYVWLSLVEPYVKKIN